MKLALALLLFTAPALAQPASDQNIVVNVVVTLVKGGIPVPAPVPAPSPSPVPSPVPAPDPSPVSILNPAPVNPINPDPTTPSPANPGSTACVNNYPGAAKSISDVSTALLQAQQLYNSAFSQGQIPANVYNIGTNTLSLVRRDSSDVRDLVRIAGPTDVVSQNITFVSAEISTFTKLLGTTTQLTSNLSSLVNSMETSLQTAKTLVAASSCPQSIN